MREGKWMERKYVARNGVTERTRFLVGRSARPRARKSQRTTERKQEGNRNSAAHQLGRLLNNNFTQADYFLTLEYSPAERRALQKAAVASLPKKHTADDTRDEIMRLARQDAMLLIRRLRRLYKEQGAELRAIVVTSDMENSGKKKANIHHHIVISGEPMKLEAKNLTICGKRPEELWGKGMTGWECLRGGSYNAIASYLIKQVRDIANWKKWTCTRNLEKIVPEEYELKEGVDATEEIKIPAGSTAQERLWFGETATCQYVRYLPPAQKVKRGGHKSRREKT